MSGRRSEPAAFVPPHSVEAERSLIGAVLLTGRVDDALPIVDPGDFHDPTLRHVYAAARALFHEAAGIDAVTVLERMKATGVDIPKDLPARLYECQQAAPTTDAARYATIIRGHALRRAVIAASERLRSMALTGLGEEDLIEAAQQAFFEIATGASTRDTMRPASDYIPEYLDAFEARGESRGMGLPTGWPDLDDRLLGLHPGALYVIGARPRMGKTTMALNMASAAISAGSTVLMFSLEMRQEELYDRLVSARADIPLSDIREGKVRDPEAARRFARETGALAEAGLLIDDDRTVTLADIRAKARTVRARHGRLDLIVVDYVQLMAGEDDGRRSNREQEISEISRGLKIVAGEIGCPVVALAQLNRDVEKRDNKIPGLSDLRQSGSLEQDADVVLFLYRDEVYNPQSKQKGLALVKIAKQRAGEEGMVWLRWVPSRCKFVPNVEEAPDAVLPF